MEDKTKKVLSICMPTYNRPECIRKSLEHYEKIIAGTGVKGKVQICISDNSPSTETEEEVARWKGRLDVKYSRNNENLGYDRNALLAMGLADGEFAQLVGDELIYCARSLKRVVEELEMGGCDVLMFDDDKLFHKGNGEFQAMLEGKGVWKRALSYGWVKKRSITHIDYVIVRNEDFRRCMARIGGRVGEFYGLTFVQLSFYFFSLMHACKVCVIDGVNDREAANAPRREGVYFPSDDARVIYCKYFFEVKKCFECGVIGKEDYERFKGAFFLSAINHLFRIRSHMYPRIYEKEEAETLKQVVMVEKEYGGIAGLALRLMRRALFIRAVPYHLVYSAFVFFRNIVLRKPRRSALELYEKCLDGKESEERKLYRTDF